MRCPCGSGLNLERCCGPYIEGEAQPPTAEALMRARFSAYVLHRPVFIYNTWQNPPDDLETLARDIDHVQFTHLEILQTEGGQETDSTGRVAFIAHWKKGHKQGELRENSRFEKHCDIWSYVDGQPLTTAQLAQRKPIAREGELFTAPIKALPKPGRNDLCPCGSGVKYKKCCGR